MAKRETDTNPILAAIRAESWQSKIPGSLTRYVSMRDVERIFAEHATPTEKV